MLVKRRLSDSDNSSGSRGGSAVGTSSIVSRRHQPSCRVQLTALLSHRQSRWPFRAGTRRGFSRSQVTKKVAVISVVTETDPSGAHPQLWYTTLAGSPEVQKTVKLSQGLHVDGIIGVPVTTPLPELTAALEIPQSRCLARAAVVTVWQSQRANAKQTG